MCLLSIIPCERSIGGSRHINEHFAMRQCHISKLKKLFTMTVFVIAQTTHATIRSSDQMHTNHGTWINWATIHRSFKNRRYVCNYISFKLTHHSWAIMLQVLLWCAACAAILVYIFNMPQLKTSNLVDGNQSYWCGAMFIDQIDKRWWICDVAGIRSIHSLLVNTFTPSKGGLQYIVLCILGRFYNHNTLQTPLIVTFINWIVLSLQPISTTPIQSIQLMDACQLNGVEDTIRRNNTAHLKGTRTYVDTFESDKIGLRCAGTFMFFDFIRQNNAI